MTGAAVAAGVGTTGTGIMTGAGWAGFAGMPATAVGIAGFVAGGFGCAAAGGWAGFGVAAGEGVCFVDLTATIPAYTFFCLRM